MTAPVNLLVNGQLREFAVEAMPSNLAELIASLELDGSMVVAEVNGEIIKRSEYSSCRLSDGDKIELVRFVGGG